MPPSPSPSSLPAPRAFVVTAPGLEPLAHGELQALGVRDARVEAGGVDVPGDADTLYLAIGASTTGGSTVRGPMRRGAIVVAVALIGPTGP